MKTAEFYLTSSLEKVMPTRKPSVLSPGFCLSGWRGTRAAVQLVYYYERKDRGWPAGSFRIEITGAPAAEQRYKVDLVPVERTSYECADDDFISHDPGLFPDVLTPLEEEFIKLYPRQYRSIWLSWDIPDDAPCGDYEVHVKVLYPAANWDMNGTLIPVEAEEQTVKDLAFTLSVKRALLKKQTTVSATVVHADCLADYYGVEVFSEEHWRILENHIRAAGRTHNSILAPLFTPPYDTAVNTERPTVQLVDVFLNQEEYSFGFEKLERWAAICRKYGVEYLDMPAFFTQWGATATPKIIAVVDGEEKRIFGWDVPASSPAYRKFLCAFIPAVRKKLEELGYDRDHLFFKVSDEPQEDQLEGYLTAQAQLSGLLDDAQCIEAITNTDYIRSGLVKIPIIPIDCFEQFENIHLARKFVYYCCVQDNKVPNRFIAMESCRQRIMGVLLYLTDPTGFAHWAYDYYNSAYSVYRIDPYRSEHADWCFPAGDAYLVYPGKKGEVVFSVRSEVQDDVMWDLRALQTLEGVTSRDYVERIIYEGTDIGRFSYTNYPRDPSYLLNLRERVANELDKYWK